MAIAVDTADTTNRTASASSLTYAFNNAAGNVLAVLSMSADQTIPVTGVTYNTVAMTSGVTYNSATGSTDIQGWYLASPATGSHNIVVTAGSSTQIQSGAISFSGANTSSPLGDTTTHTGQAPGANTAVSVSITSNNASQYLVVYWEANGATGGTTTATGTNETATWIRESPSRGGVFSRISTTTTGSKTSTIQQSGGGDQSWVTIIWGIKQAAAAGPANWKTYNTNVKANIKTLNTNAIANIKTYDTIS